MKTCITLNCSTGCYQVMVTNVTSLLKTVKAVEDEATKGTRALEATIEHIKQELAVSNSFHFMISIIQAQTIGV